MRDFRQKKQFRKFAFSWPSIALLAVVLFFVGRATWGVYLKAVQSQQTADQSQKELSDLQARQTTLTANIARLNTSYGVEEEIRQKYRMTKPGEHVAVIVTADNSSSTQVQSGDGSIWSKVLNFFHF